jgi:hypothetical protein
MPTQTVFNMEGATPAGTSVAGGVGTAGPALVGANQVVVNTGSAVSSTTCVIRGSLGITFTSGGNAQSLGRWLSQAPGTVQSVSFAFVYNATPNAALLVCAPRSSSAQAVRVSVSTTNTLTVTTSAGASTVTVASGLVPNTVYWVTLRMAVGSTTTGAFTCNLYTSALALIAGNSNNAYNLGTAPVVGGDFGIVNTNAAAGTAVSVDYIMFEDSANELFPPATAFSGALSLSGVGALTLIGKAGFSGSVGLTGAGTLGFAGSPGVTDALNLSGAGTLGYAAVASFVQTLALNASGSLAYDGVASLTATLALAGGGALTLTGTPGAAGELNFAGEGSIAFTGTTGRSGVLLMGGSGALSIVGVSGTGGILQLSGSGTLDMEGNPALSTALMLGGGGDLSFDATLALFATMDMAGAGTLTFHQTVAAHHKTYGSTGLTTRWSGSISGSRWAGNFTTRWNGTLNG